MRKESLHIAIACFVGTVLGLLVAFKLAEMFAVGRSLWFLGAFLGAGVAYLAYDPISVWNAVKRAWRELADGERVLRFLYRAFFVTATIAEFVALVAVIIAGIVFTFAGGAIGAEVTHLWGEEVGAAWMLAALGSFGFALIGMLVLALYEESKESANAYRKPQDPAPEMSFREWLRVAALMMNPISLPLVLIAGNLYFLWEISCGLAWLVWRLPKALWQTAIFATRLLYRTFVLIHSTERTVCFVDSALGVAVAYTQVSPTLAGIFAGGLIGLALGVLNYEIFSVRILKLAPARARK